MEVVAILFSDKSVGVPLQKKKDFILLPFPFAHVHLEEKKKVQYQKLAVANEFFVKLLRLTLFRRHHSEIFCTVQ